MFEPFPGNYVWNLSVNLAVTMGGAMGEIDTANREIMAAAHGDEAAGTEAFFHAWCALAERLIGLAEEDEAQGRSLSAGDKYRRACIYLMTAERMQRHGFAPRTEAYARMLRCFEKAVTLGRARCERVEIPYGDSAFPALFVPAEGRTRGPCMVFCNGLDSVKEMVFFSGAADELARRGVSCLIVDQPGVGEALRLRGLTAVLETERWAGAAVDALEQRADVDPDRIGMMGWSLGGYYAPRAAAFEPRFKLCAVWGANPDWGEVQRRRLQREGDNPVPHYWEHVMWVWGYEDLDAFIAFADRINLHGVTEKIRVPFLIAHGENDRQIPVAYAHDTFKAAVNSPHRELRIFTAREGGVEHCSADNMIPARTFIADWVSEQFSRMEASQPARREPRHAPVPE